MRQDATNPVHPWLNGEVGLALPQGDAVLTIPGPANAWPDALRSAVSTILGSGFPMFVVWGPARTLLYNDAYIDILGGKHPQALGQGFWDVWPEVRSQIEPVIDSAFAGRSWRTADVVGSRAPRHDYVIKIGSA